MTLEAKIEALLFFRGEATSIKKLAQTLDESEEDILSAIENLKHSLDERGIVVLQKDDEVILGTNPELGSLIEKIVKEELHKDLGRAGLETLSIILYLGPVSRSQIDYIRGVSSTFILRNLLIRGLVERVDNPDDKRSFLYKPTFELLSYLGIKTIEELPEYREVRAELITKKEAAQKELEDDSAEAHN
jgi:segregation and condensation protein B